MSTPDPIVFTCSHGVGYTAFELDIGGRLDFDYRAQQEDVEWNLHSDQDHEDQLARAFIYGESDIPWPEYADPPCEDVDEQEVIL